MDLNSCSPGIGESVVPSFAVCLSMIAASSLSCIAFILSRHHRILSFSNNTLSPLFNPKFVHAFRELGNHLVALCIQEFAHPLYK
ncbi:hypothetical protein ALT1000_200020 [Alteromonas macleodii]